MVVTLIGEILATLILAHISESKNINFFRIYFSGIAISENLGQKNFRKNQSGKIWRRLIVACVMV